MRLPEEFFRISLLPTYCRDAAKHFSLAFIFYQPHAATRRSIRMAFSWYLAAMRRSIFLWSLLAKNLMPRCGEAFFIGLFLLRT
jgi:hypothetical protein